MPLVPDASEGRRGVLSQRIDARCEQVRPGYGAAQALPGPLFTFAAYLGAVAQPSPHGALGAAIALVAIFLPGLLLLVGVLPFWDHLRVNQTSRARRAAT